MILLVRYNGLFGALTRSSNSDFDLLDKCINMDIPIKELVSKNNFGVLFSSKMVSALNYHGFFYLTGGTSYYKQPPLVLINTNHRLFKEICL